MDIKKVMKELSRANRLEVIDFIREGTFPTVHDVAEGLHYSLQNIVPIVNTLVKLGFIIKKKKYLGAPLSKDQTQLLINPAAFKEFGTQLLAIAE
jgi:Mn-dependent DtxR family transcriptional regulator